MKAIKIIGEILLYFCIMAVILLIFKKSLGFEHSILPYAGGSTIGWLIWRMITYVFGKSKSKNEIK